MLSVQTQLPRSSRGRRRHRTPTFSFGESHGTVHCEVPEGGKAGRSVLRGTPEIRLASRSLPVDDWGMAKDILFLLRPDFADGEGAPYYCPECAELTGVLTYYPQLQQSIDVRRVDYPRPRPDLIALLGQENQSCPVLVLGAETPDPAAGARQAPDGRHQFISGARKIGEYLSRTYGVGRPH